MYFLNFFYFYFSGGKDFILGYRAPVMIEFIDYVQTKMK